VKYQVLPVYSIPVVTAIYVPLIKQRGAPLTLRDEEEKVREKVRRFIY